MCIFYISHLIQNSKCCSTLEVVHAISLKIYKHDKKASKLKRTVKDIFSKEIKKMTTSGAITERVNKFGAIKGSIF